MNDLNHKLKSSLEDSFSMPFDVSRTIVDGEEHYICWPSNEGETYFSVTVFIHDQIRLIVEIAPQKYGRSILEDMSIADDYKKNCFFDYLKMMRDLGGKVQFRVNDIDVSGIENWPTSWRSFSCKITKVPIDVYNKEDEFEIMSEWMRHGVSLIFSLLTIDYQEALSDSLGYEEGAKKQTISTRYERNPINRQLCLYKKGYTCVVCGTNLFEKYGKVGRKYIEVHHTTPVSMMGENYKVDIDKDLVPLCPNCHAMIHRRNPPYDIDELREMIREDKKILKNIEDDSDVRNLIYNLLHMNDKVTDIELQRQVLKKYGERYPDMSLNDWRHIIADYTSMVRPAAKVVSMNRQDYGIAAEDRTD